MTAYIKATNTGNGFITHEDKEVFDIVNVSDDVWKVSGDYQAWAARVGGVEQDSATWQKYEANQPILAEIAALEAKQARCVREAIVHGDTTRAKALDDQIAALRATLSR